MLRFFYIIFVHIPQRESHTSRPLLATGEESCGLDRGECWREVHGSVGHDEEEAEQAAHAQLLHSEE